MQYTTILGLSLSTRTLGLAVLSQGQLMDLGIQLRKEPWTPRKKEHILASLQPWCSSYTIHQVALSIPYEKQLTPEIKDLLNAIRRYFQNKKIPLKAYPLQTVYAFLDNAKSRKEMMSSLVLLHPELAAYYRKEIKNKNKYYTKLFEAVGVATLHYQRLKEAKRKGKE